MSYSEGFEKHYLQVGDNRISINVIFDFYILYKVSVIKIKKALDNISQEPHLFYVVNTISEINYEYFLLPFD